MKFSCDFCGKMQYESDMVYNNGNYTCSGCFKGLVTHYYGKVTPCCFFTFNGLNDEFCECSNCHQTHRWDSLFDKVTQKCKVCGLYEYNDAEFNSEERKNYVCARCKKNPYQVEKNADKIKPDNVNHPSHYKGKGLECIQVIEAFNLGFNLGNAIKYILRAGKKGSRHEDLKKSLWYIKRELDGEESSTE